MNKSATDKSSEDFQQELKGYVKKDLTTLRKFLMDVVNGKRKDSQFDQKSGKVIEKPIPIQVRVDATKAYKALIMDKAVATVKDSQEINITHNHVDSAVEKVEARKLAEKKEREQAAREVGKLAKVAVGGQ